ncbi:MAG: T9SS type A sorting domain-containing protein, partial [Saprospiraceae bacterium]|nr:T9SS type A sorting domain-containing protein [Saprospiraceae bacterium]
AFDWGDDHFRLPSWNELVLYEMHIGTFHDAPGGQPGTFESAMAMLPYLQQLGINVIEVMPIAEFPGDFSWGYNPSHPFAVESIYGGPDAFKQFVKAAHQHGIGVILDVVYNHAFSQSPLAQLYWDPANFRPAPDNPWLNVTARHPFNVGYDFNHESAATRKFVDQVMTYWLEEFRVDGFRFDLSKGFTQTNSGSNVDLWGQYDASRIAILKHYADVVWAANENAYVILEHFAANSEEIELHAYGNGIFFWSGGGVHNQYLEGAMGYNSDFTGALHTSRGWTQPNLVAYMESHDEERMMYKNLQFGNSSGGYNVKNFLTALKRVELASAFFYPLPGPKMLWQFGELGYEFPINYCPDGTIAEGCRVANKPIRWDYADSPNRTRIYDVKRALIELKTTYDVFSTTNFQTFLQGPTKRIHLLHPEMDVAVLGNFNVTPDNVQSPFPHTGWWYEYFSGDSLLVSNAGTALPLTAGEYRLYTTTRLNAPPGGYITSDTDIQRPAFDLTLAPNPASGSVQVGYILPESASVQIEVLDLQGRRVLSLPPQQQGPGAHQITFDAPPASGVYLVKCLVNGQVAVSKLVVER